ncbi:c-di-GMP receptor LapD [Enterovibrio norvegicus]|uniref:bifunctional diguanylate cyclase/phosphodiesterase n=1 Tax=Enterovibrio norvegicus TaxID=188144 RepID=UPI000C824840|nr:EAL domain-containing protein [Enterovibrio norvegicus]PMI32603.1 c-di-GMP receptor LapD [Enterovibrio norvegicus]PMN45350.1 c-di-GMP receptor LapD [Enterovibrio norvegicus]
MTITNKITLVVIGILLLLCSVLAVAEFSINLAFLQQEMQLQAQSAMQNLSIALIPILETGDKEKSELFFSTVMSEGTRLNEATLKWMFDDEFQNWSHQTGINQKVPEWFMSLGFVEPISLTSTINNGWTDLGTLSITVTSDYAYLALWELSVPFTIFAIAVIVVATILVRVALKRALSPVVAMTKEAKRIAQLDFSAKIPTPKDTDLRELTHSFNDMSSQIQNLFDTLNEEMNALRQKYLFDQASGFPNRSFLMRQLESWLSEGDCGVLMFANLKWLEEVKPNEGNKSLNDSLTALRKSLEKVLPHSNDAFAARVGKSELAIFVPSVHEKQARTLLSALIRTFSNEVIMSGLSSANAFTIGIAEKKNDDTVATLLSRANTALQEAEESQKVFLFASAGEELSSTQIDRGLESAINANTFGFKLQPILSKQSHEIQHYEAYAQIPMDNEFVPAKNLVSDLSRLSLSNKFDQSVVNQMIDVLKSDMTFKPVSVNLTANSVKNPEFVKWLIKTVKKNQLRERLLFEFAEAVVCLSPEDCEVTCQRFREAGIKFGIDRFGQHLSSVSYLRALKPTFVKLDHSFLQNGEEDNNHLLLTPMIKMASSLGIEVIASAVEYKQQLNHLSNTNIDGYFGYISPPVTLESLTCDVAKSA